MKTVLLSIAMVVALATSYGLGYYHRGSSGPPNASELRISIDGAEDELTLAPLAKGETLSVGAMEVAVRNETAPDANAQFPHAYGDICPLKERDPVRVAARSDDAVLLEVTERSPDGLFDSGDRIVRHDLGDGVTRTVFYCPVGTLFLLDRRHADIERVRHLSTTASYRQQRRVNEGERTLIRGMLRENGGR